MGSSPRPSSPRPCARPNSTRRGTRLPSSRATHALEVHGLDAHSDDRTVWDGFKGRHGMFHADAWEQGYRRALKTHGLAWSERDSREIWHNPYNATDRNAAIQNAASTTAMAMQNAADTLRR